MLVSAINFNKNKGLKSSLTMQNPSIKYTSQPKADTVCFGNNSRFIRRDVLQLDVVNQHVLEAVEKLPPLVQNIFRGVKLRSNPNSSSFFISEGIYPSNKIHILLEAVSDLSINKGADLSKFKTEEELGLCIKTARDFNMISEGYADDFSNLRGYCLSKDSIITKLFDAKALETSQWPHKTHFGIDVSVHDKISPESVSIDYFSEEMRKIFKDKFAKNKTFMANFGNDKFVVSYVKPRPIPFDIYEGISVETIQPIKKK